MKNTNIAIHLLTPEHFVTTCKQENMYENILVSELADSDILWGEKEGGFWFVGSGHCTRSGIDSALEIIKELDLQATPNSAIAEIKSRGLVFEHFAIFSSLEKATDFAREFLAGFKFSGSTITYPDLPLVK